MTLQRNEDGKRETKSVTTDSKYVGGWSTAYSAPVILLQLQSFLFDLHVPQEHGEAHKTNHITQQKTTEALNQAYYFQCHDCGYNVTFDSIKGGPRGDP